MVASGLNEEKNPTPNLLDEAIAHREAGYCKEAVQVLQRWLVGNSKDATAHALLAQVLSLDKQDGSAWEAMNKALSLNPALPIVQRNLARLLLKQQKTDQALRAAQAAYQSDAADLENQLVLASALGANNQSQQAFQLLAGILQGNPNYAEAFAQRALLKLRSKDFAAALADAEKSLSIKPHLGQMWSIVGLLRYQFKNLPGAIEALEKAHDCEPNNIGYLVNLGEFKRQAGATEAAIVLLEKATSMAPGNVGAWINLGTAFQQARRIAEAKAAYAKILEMAPEQAEVASNLGALAKEEENWEEALRYFNQALVHQPTRAAILTNKAAALNALEQYVEAEQVARHAIEIEPAYIEAHLALIGALTGKKHYAAAQSVLDMLIKSSDPSVVENTHRLALAYATLFRVQYRWIEAEAWVRRALEVKPGQVKVLCQLGVILDEQQRYEDAWEVLQAALKNAPEDADTLQAMSGHYGRQARWTEAEALARKALEKKPNSAEIHNNLGVALYGLGRFKDAEACYRKALQIKPDYADAHNNLGVTLKYLGRLDEAVACYRRTVEINQDNAEVYYNLGIILKELGRLDEAEASYRRALQIKPHYADAYNNWGITLKDLGRLDEAEASYYQALKIKPDYAEAHNNLGIILKDRGHLEEAETYCRQALKIKPDYADAHNNLGIILKDRGCLEEAEVCCRQVLEIEPKSADAYNNLGIILEGMGLLDEAEASYRQALGIKADHEDAFGNMLFTLNYHPDKSGEEIFEVYREYDARFGQSQRSEWQPHSNNRETRRQLKVGYVSPDFRKHSVRNFLEPVLANHDKQVVEVYAYAELMVEDTVTARYKNYMDHWIPTCGLSDEVLAKRIRADGIDILVDLAGHTGNNRLGVFARKPAPVSLSWLGFGYSTGLTAIDYFLTDELYAPPGCEGVFSEKLWRLEKPSLVYRPAEDMGSVNALPALMRGYVTFGTLTRGVRINHRTIRVWAELLKQVPNARLVIDSRDFQHTTMQERLAEKFAAHGILRERLEIGYHTPPWDTLRGIDVGLDCFPHNSGTTLFESLYMGVPFVTLQGRPSVGCLGRMILQGVGHPEWVAQTEDEYVTIAVSLAQDLAKLADRRKELRTKMVSGPLMNEFAFARKIEAAYQDMFAKWADGKSRG